MNEQVEFLRFLNRGQRVRRKLVVLRYRGAELYGGLERFRRSEHRVENGELHPYCVRLHRSRRRVRMIKDDNASSRFHGDKADIQR